jgi:hypothetical protein
MEIVIMADKTIQTSRQTASGAPQGGLVLEVPTTAARQLPEVGSHPAVLVGLIDLGTHEDTYGERTTRNPRVLLAWELVDTQDPYGDHGHVLVRDYTLSLGRRSNLRKLLEGWIRPLNDGEKFVLGELLGKACLVSVVHSSSSQGTTFAKVEAVVKLPRSMPLPKSRITPMSWQIGGDARLPDFRWLPFLYGKPVADKITESDEWRQITAPGQNGFPGKPSHAEESY